MNLGMFPLHSFIIKKNPYLLSELVGNESKHRTLHSYWPLNRGKTIEARSSGRQKVGRGRFINVAA